MEEPYISGEAHKAMKKSKTHRTSDTAQLPWKYIAAVAIILLIIVSISLPLILRGDPAPSGNEPGNYSQGQDERRGEGPQGCSDAKCTAPALPGSKSQPNVQSQ